MSLDLIKLQEEHEKLQNPDKLPEWVNTKNASFSAWRYLDEQKDERLNYINSHKKISDFKKKSLWQISVSEVARAISVSSVTLDPQKGSRWAVGFRDELATINDELAQAKNKRLNTYKKNKAKGVARSSNNELLLKCQKLEKELQEEKQKNADQQWFKRVSKLSLPVKQILGLNDY